MPLPRKRFPFVFLDAVLFYFRETREDQQIHAILEFTGRIGFERLRRAVRLSLDAEPILGCRLVHHPVEPWWERRADLENVEYCRLVQAEDATRSLHSFLTAPLDPFRDPLIQVCVIRGDDDVLVVKVSHMIMDGAGINEYLRLLAGLYGRLKETPDFEPAPNLTGSRSLRQITRRLSLMEKMKLVRRSLRDLKRDCIHLLEKIRIETRRRNGSGEPAWGLPLERGNREDRAFVIRKLPAHQVRSLREHARAHGATLNDAMLTAFIRAIHRHFAPQPGPPLRIRTIANLRRYLPDDGGAALCNLCGYVPVNIGSHPGTEFPETLLRVRDRMRSHKADFIGLGVFPRAIGVKFLPFFMRQMLARLENGCMDRGYVKPLPKFSNIGDMHPERFDFDGLTIMDAYQLGTVGYAPGFTVGTTAFEGSLTLSVGICNPARNAPIFERLFDGMEEEIVSALK